MRYRRLGRTELQVPVVGFGAWAIGGWYWGGTDDDLALGAVRAALDAGMTAIDTAPVYGFGHSERVVGRAIAGRRDEVVLMTKVGLRWDDPRGEFHFRTVDAKGDVVRVHRNARPDSVRTEVERSLERLAVEHVDLIQVHWPDPTTPVAETMGALAELRAEGKVREIGVSNYPPDLVEEARLALGDVPLASDQCKYSLVARDIERDLLPYARAREVGVLAYSPLEQGLLTGEVPESRSFPADDGRNKRPSFRRENRRRTNAVLSEVVEPIARARGRSIAQAVLAWTIAQPGVTSALVGARSAEQARANAAAGDVELAPEELARIDGAFRGLELDLAPGGGGVLGMLRRMARGGRG